MDTRKQLNVIEAGDHSELSLLIIIMKNRKWFIIIIDIIIISITIIATVVAMMVMETMMMVTTATRRILTWSNMDSRDVLARADAERSIRTRHQIPASRVTSLRGK